MDNRFQKQPKRCPQTEGESVYFIVPGIVGVLGFHIPLVGYAAVMFCAASLSWAKRAK